MVLIYKYHLKVKQRKFKYLSFFCAEGHRHVEGEGLSSLFFMLMRRIPGYLFGCQ